MRLSPTRRPFQLALAAALAAPMPVWAGQSPRADTGRAAPVTTVSQRDIDSLPTTAPTYRDLVTAAAPTKENPKDSINWQALRGGQADQPVPGGVSADMIRESTVLTQREWPGEAMGMNGPILVQGKIGNQDAVGVYTPGGAPVYFATMKEVKANPDGLQQALTQAYEGGGGYSGGSTVSTTRPDGSTETISREADGSRTRMITAPDGKVISREPIDNTPTKVPPREHGTSGSTKDENGNTVTYKKNPDGSTTRTVTDPSGKTIESGPVEQPPVTKPAPREKGTSGSTTDANGNTVTYKKNPDGTTTKTVTTPDGQQLSQETMQPEPVTKTAPREKGTSGSTKDENGNTITYKKNPDGSTTRTVTDPSGKTLESGPVEQPPVTKPKPREGGNTASATDENGNTITVTKQPDGGKIRTVTDPSGRVIESGPVTPPPATKPKPHGPDSASTTDENGNTITITKQPDGSKVRTVTAPDGTTIITEPVNPPPITKPKPKSGISSASIVREDGTIETIQLNKDGTRTRLITDANGRPLAADPLLPVEQAHQAAVAQKQAHEPHGQGSRKDGGAKDGKAEATPPAPNPAVSDAPVHSILDDIKEDPAGPTHPQPNGTPTVRTTGDGTLVRTYPDGTTEYTSPDGAQFIRYGDDTTFQRFPDGTTVQRTPDGAETHRTPDGTITKQTPPTVVNVGPGGKTPPGAAGQYLQPPQNTTTPTTSGTTQPQGAGSTGQPQIIGTPEQIKKQKKEIRDGLQQYLTPTGQNLTGEKFKPFIYGGIDPEWLHHYQDQGLVSPDGTSGVTPNWNRLDTFFKDKAGGGMERIDPPALAQNLPAGTPPVALDYGLGSKWSVGSGYGFNKFAFGTGLDYTPQPAPNNPPAWLNDPNLGGGIDLSKVSPGYAPWNGAGKPLDDGGKRDDYRYAWQRPTAPGQQWLRPGLGPVLPSYGKSGYGVIRPLPSQLTFGKPLVKTGNDFWGSHYFGKGEFGGSYGSIYDDYYEDGGKGFPISHGWDSVTFMQPPSLWSPNKIYISEYGLPDEDGYRYIADAVLTIKDGRWEMEITYYEEDCLTLRTKNWPPNDPLYDKGEQAAQQAQRKRQEARRPQPDMSIAAPPEMGMDRPEPITRKEPVVKAIDQWGLRAVGYTPGADSAWKLSSGEKPNAIVAVIDSGLDLGHPDAPANLWTNPDEIPGNGIDDDANGYVDDVNGWNFVDESNDLRDRWGHGTLVAGIIAAKRDNGQGIAGINPGARIMVLKVANDKGVANSLALYRAIHYAADHGARVINISLGDAGRSRLEQLAVNYAHMRGCMVVAAAGNENADVTNYGPAGLRRVISVGALGFEGTRHPLSNWGPNTALLAPGEDIYSLQSRDADWPGPAMERERLYRAATGTSFAAPIVSATASLLFAEDPTRSNRQVEALLASTAKDLDREGWDPTTGWGVLDARAALQADPKRVLVVLPTEVVVSRKGKKADAVEVYGVIGGALQRYEVSLGQGRNPSDWAPLAQSVRLVGVGRICRVDGEALKGAKEWTVRITATGEDGSRRIAYVPISL